MVKHLGEAMLSRQKPPKVGARFRTISTNSSEFWVLMARGTASTLAKVLKITDLASSLGSTAWAPTLPNS